MTVARSVAEVLTDRVTLEIESIDRMYLNVYVPGLQYTGGVASFFQAHRGHPFPSSALMDPISKDFVAGLHRICHDLGVPMIDFEKGSARTTSRCSTWPGSPARRKCCSSARRRRRPGSFVRRSAATPTPGRPTRGS